jgi:geranylgeranyl diphosphate synthase type II
LDLTTYKTTFLSYLDDKIKVKEPNNLYEPITYILNLGGKKLRPILTLLSCDLNGENHKKALSAALAVEVFHNFTLLHDDIMDNASMRRGQATVHEKWNVNTGILSGDAMMIIANQLLETYNGDTFKRLMQVFNKTALEVCEGQQYDMDFETRSDVTIPEYIKMIRCKTAVLIACALKMGAIVANAKDEDAHKMYDFGLNLGLAFQLQDDYLDTFGTVETFGKRIGGDILENKKTFLYLNVLEKVSDSDKKNLLDWHETKDRPIQKIKAITDLYIKYDIPSLVKSDIESYTKLAFNSIETMDLSNDNKAQLIHLGNQLINRNV